MIGQTADDFMVKELVPRLPELLKLDYELSRELLRKAGELGLLGVEIPEEYGGLGLDKVSGCLVAEKAGRDGSFATTFAVQIGIGTLPIVYFGTEAQKKKYLPKLASGEWVSSYSLSEASSASDAMNAKARAVLSPDGKSWILNGEKMWLSNAGFADVYITFAKVDGEHFTAFIVEKGMPGVSLGAEEKKTGIKGSSTRPLILTDAVIPRENLLGEIGKGHKIAFNILNVGRFKLGAMVTGGAKLTARRGRRVRQLPHRVREAHHELRAHQAQDRPDGHPRLRLRVDGLPHRRDDRPQPRRRGPRRPRDRAASGSRSTTSSAPWSRSGAPRCCDYVVDETVQIFGGAGFVEDYPAERYWRDARVNRIYEGTNEINRLLVPGRLIRRAMKGELPIFQKAMALLDELTAGPSARAARRGLPGRRGRACSPGPRRWPSCAWARRCRSAARRSRTSRRSSATSPTSPWRPTPSRARSCGPASARRRAARTRRGCRRRPCAATPRTRWTRSRPRPASSWPRWRRATRSRTLLAAAEALHEARGRATRSPCAARSPTPPSSRSATRSGSGSGSRPADEGPPPGIGRGPWDEPTGPAFDGAFADPSRARPIGALRDGRARGR